MKKFKILLIILAIIILVGGGYLLYIFKFKEYDVADEKVSEIVAEPYKVELPDGSTIFIDENGEIIEQTSEGNKISASKNNTNAINETTDSSNDSSNGKTSNESTSVSTNNSNDSSNSKDTISTGDNSGNTNNSETTTVATIKDKYRASFEGLEAQADSKINALIGHAMEEYSSESGEGVNFGYFYNKYMTAANGLENNTDTIFNAVILAVEKDLIANGYDKSYAQSFRDEYEATKKARRDSILSKALKR